MRRPAVLVVLAGLVLAAVPGCGLTLDVDPPDVTDAGGGMDGGSIDGGGDAGPVPCRNDDACSDGDACNGLEVCIEGACVAGEPVECDDGDACNGLETCEAGECLPGEELACPDDGDACNGSEICDPAIGCRSVDPVVCDDGVDCTHDACADGNCTFTPQNAECDLVPGGVCDATLGCQYPTCDATTCASDPCTVASCEGTTCVRTPRCGEGLRCCGGSCVESCDDDDDCTEDVCGPTGCEHLPIDDGRPCAGDACAVAPRCFGGHCTASATRSCADSEPCTLDTCDPLTGCLHTPAPSTTPCSDGDACTLGDACVAGSCAAGPDRLACITTACTSSRCDPSVGCVSEPISAGTPCTGGGTCDRAGNCCSLSQSDCDGDGICECEDGVCEGGRCRTSCLSASSCAAGELCCLGGGTGRTFCYPDSCLSCCMVVGTP